MASPDLTIKNGDTRGWVFTISDSASAALNLTSCRVRFVLRRHEWHTSDLFVRDTSGTGSDSIAIAANPATGVVTITPTANDWADLSDAVGVFVGEFRISDRTNTNYQYTDDVLVRVDEAMI
jgi:hypothetical protein